MSYLQRFGSDKRILKRRYKKLTGKELDLVNPALFNEKLQWLKLYDRRPIHTQCADKVAVRDFVMDKTKVDWQKIKTRLAKQLDRNFYSPDWKLLPLNYDQGEPGHDLQKPDRLEEMITLTETLSTVFPYARVVWYCFDNQLHFGEITFYPASGFKEFTPEKWNTYFGELIDISSFEKD